MRPGTVAAVVTMAFVALVLAIMFNCGFKGV